MRVLLLAVTLSFATPSLQRCTSTVASTECERVTFARGQPFQVAPYKPLLQFKSGGNLDEIPAGTFKLLPEVTTLYLSFNTIKRLEAGSFTGLTKLQKLNLNHNQLETVPDGSFQGCTTLVTLDLGGNKIKKVEANAFAELVDLEELSLSFNQLKRVPSSLGVLRKLKKLDLSNNQISSLGVGGFVGLNALEVLNLESNKIRDVPDDAFRGLRNLKEINLKDNYVSSLNAANLINNLQALKTIKLNINDFVCSTLRALVRKLEASGIDVTRGVSRANVTVNGIACKSA